MTKLSAAQIFWSLNCTQWTLAWQCWWGPIVHHAGSLLSSPVVRTYTAAELEGWGGVCGIRWNMVPLQHPHASLCTGDHQNAHVTGHVLDWLYRWSQFSSVQLKSRKDLVDHVIISMWQTQLGADILSLPSSCSRPITEMLLRHITLQPFRLGTPLLQLKRNQGNILITRNKIRDIFPPRASHYKTRFYEKGWPGGVCKWHSNKLSYNHPSHHPFPR